MHKVSTIVRAIVFTGAAAGTLAIPASAQDAPAQPAPLNASAETASRNSLADSLEPVLQTFVDARLVPGLSVEVTDAKQSLARLDVGGRLPASSDGQVIEPLTGEELFWIASVTKPISATAFMMLVDEGLVDLDDPISNYLPEFKDCKTSDDVVRTITVRHCLTHTSGLQHDRKADVASRSQLFEQMSSAPLKFIPGEEWEYSRSLDVIAGVAEKVSGKSFDAFLGERLLQPLGMNNTTFQLNGEQADRVVPPTVLDSKTGGLKLAEADYVSFEAGGNTWASASGGLFSTTSDLAKFARFILNKGRVGNKRLLSEQSVNAMTSVQTGDLVSGWTPGNGWGLGWCVVRQPQHVTRSLAPLSFGHGGVYGPQFWIDPHREVAFILALCRKDIKNADGSDFREAFQVTAARALDANTRSASKRTAK